MIGRLAGQLAEINPNQLIVDVNGVGYLVQAPVNLISQLQVDQPVTLHIQTVVREDAITLYGFQTLDDKRLFELLTTVSGVGPKLALAILSSYTASQIQTAVTTGNTAAFTQVSGIGKKNAERIILELRNKVAVSQLDADLTPQTANAELTQALVSLGYAGSEIIKASQTVDASLPLTEQIKQSLKLLTE